MCLTDTQLSGLIFSTEVYWAVYPKISVSHSDCIRL